MLHARSLDEAIAALKRNPSQAVEADIEGLHVQLQVKARRSAADLFRQAGPWEGESADELSARLAAARKAGGASPTLA